MSRYAILRSFIEDEEEIAAFERAEEDYQESEDISAPYEELERVIAEDRRRHDQEAEQFLTADYYRQNPEALSNIQKNTNIFDMKNPPRKSLVLKTKNTPGKPALQD
ncbi:hypothetical protein EDB86DRAFT_2826691 [Lactarius hatsudake]|nr:hypothetical protein EDB86DRAFT_2826691 [Lactarius hatsudake]